MNVYEKLQLLRVKLQAINPKKTGNNKFAGYSYYELGDFIPHVNSLMDELKLTSCLSFGDIGLLEIINVEAPDERITFTAPMSTAELKGCHAVQNLGAVITYIRRYLWTNALELTEHDALDATTGKDETKPASRPNTPPADKNAPQSQPTALSDKQIGRLYAIAKGKGKSGDIVNAEIKKSFNTETASMTKQQYDKAVKHYESLPDKKAEPKPYNEVKYDTALDHQINTDDGADY